VRRLLTTGVTVLFPVSNSPSTVYTIVPIGIDGTLQLRDYGIEKESIDTLLVVQVLCCVSQPEETVRELYQLLKPGGQLIVYEHVKSEDRVSKLVQGTLFTTPFHFPLLSYMIWLELT
jgi:SAM-dependent methyltransferase